MMASIGDYIIKGVQGEFYLCKPDIFENTYEKVICDFNYPDANSITSEKRSLSVELKLS